MRDNQSLTLAEQCDMEIAVALCTYKLYYVKLVHFRQSYTLRNGHTFRGCVLPLNITGNANRVFTAAIG